MELEIECLCCGSISHGFSSHCGCEAKVKEACEKCEKCPNHCKCQRIREGQGGAEDAPKVTAERLWEIIVKYCGVNPNWGMKDNFIYMVNAALQNKAQLEYRFQGALGFGGKLFIRLGRQPLMVTCYLEDENKERKGMIKKANRELSKLSL